MIDSGMWMERFLQEQRFGIVKEYLIGDVLDFGGNQGELGRLVRGNYVCVNYDRAPMKGKTFDSIISLAVIEHLDVHEVFELFSEFRSMLNKDGIICITTPARTSKPLLEFMSSLGITDRKNIEEHKHYWNRKELEMLAAASGLEIVEYRTFQFGLNQLAVFGE